MRPRVEPRKIVLSRRKKILRRSHEARRTGRLLRSPLVPGSWLDMTQISVLMPLEMPLKKSTGIPTPPILRLAVRHAFCSAAAARPGRRDGATLGVLR